MGVTVAQMRASKKHQKKTYRTIKITFDKEKDADIIKAIEDAKKSGIKYREWLESYYEDAKNNL